MKRVDAFAEKNNLSKKEQIVLEGIMDGQKMKDIAKEIGVSRTRAQELKNKVVNNLA
ncbi:helix-turn-helix transcriptional regulator [Aneurinibacillus migulanus]|uniref:helix-turn-helix transcriptional regulator n=1 Tax=Aneurinibacillus migulanus TaxID=47500 RepID=UPI00209D718B|nr:LuxR C-terminal-related transcriptional regulator [Aneurinibacillus migulanus]